MATTVRQLKQYKSEGKPIVALTAWDYSIAQIIDNADIDLILVGDSTAMVALGYQSTIPISLDEILHHAIAVRKAVKNSLLVCDLPFLSYQGSYQQAISSAGRVLKEAGVQAVKLEGGYPAIAETVTRLVRIGIPVMGHVGLTPQSVHLLGYRQQGQTAIDSEKIIAEAVALEQAGAFSIVLEHIPDKLAKHITQKLTIPTIGIGAGADCDGQILVTADLLGLSAKKPPFVKTYADLRSDITQAVQNFSREVRNHHFLKAG